MDLLTKIKNAALGLANSGEQAVGNVVHNITTPHPQIASNPLPVQKSTPVDLSKIVGDFLHTIASQPAAPAIPFIGPNVQANLDARNLKGPTIGDVTAPVVSNGVDLANALTSPVKDITAYAKVKLNPALSKQLDVINNNKKLSLDEKSKLGSALLATQGGTNPEQSASAQRGAELGMGFTAPATGVIPAEVPGIVNAGSKATADLFKGGKTAKKVATEVAPKVDAVVNQTVQAGTKKTADLFTQGATTKSPIAQDLLNTGAQIKNTFEAITPSTKPSKGLFKRVVNATLGNVQLKGDRGVLSSDSPAGKAAVDTVIATENKITELSGQAKAALRQALNPLTDNELINLPDVIRGKAQATSDAQAHAAEVASSELAKVHQLATDTGLKVGKIENYFPQFSNAKKGPVSLDGTVLENGKSLNFGNFKARTGNNEDFVKNPDVLFHYLDSAYKTIVSKAYLGDKAQNLYGLANKTANPGQSTKTIQAMLGEGPSGGLTDELGKKITDLQRFSKLGVSSPLTNLTQQLSAVARTDIPTAIKTYHAMITNPEKTLLNAIKAGEVDPALGRRALDYLGANPNASIGSKWLQLIKFNGSERLNRIFSVNAGMTFAEKLLSQAQSGSGSAVRELQRLGIKDFTQATEQDIINAGRKVSQETQFSTGKGELPSAWDSPIGKVATQFKSFAYKQTGFVKDQAIRVGSEALKGNFKPLGTTLAAYGVGSAIEGEIINDVRSIIGNKKTSDKGLLNRYISDVLSGSSLGLFDNTGAILGDYGTAGQVGAAVGPTGSDIINLATNIGKATSGKPAALERQALRAIPGAGGALANTLVPNAYVDNYIGQNNGLDKNGLPPTPFPSTNPLDKLFGGNNTQATTGNKVSWKNSGGKTTSVDLTQKDYSGQSGIAGYKQDTSNAAKATQIWGAPTDQVSDTAKIAAYTKLGFKPDDVRYAYKADFTVNEKTSYVTDKNLPHDQLVTELVKGRVESIKGTMFASNGVLDNLRDQGLISKAEDTYLKKIKVGKDGKLATTSLSNGGLSASQIRTKIASVNSLFKNTIPANATKVVKVKSPKKPSLNFGTRTAKKKSTNQWYTSY